VGSWRLTGTPTKSEDRPALRSDDFRLKKSITTAMSCRGNMMNKKKTDSLSLVGSMAVFK
jgi:hypothetical protein